MQYGKRDKKVKMSLNRYPEAEHFSNEVRTRYAVEIFDEVLFESYDKEDLAKQTHAAIERLLQIYAFLTKGKK